MSRNYKTFAAAPGNPAFPIKHQGIKNLGNTCYLNAVLQSLLSIKPFCKFLTDKRFLESFKSIDPSLAAAIKAPA
jgi:ubiquitin C-terminal hydrolase